jgi:hypothetical protein
MDRYLVSQLMHERIYAAHSNLLSCFPSAIHHLLSLSLQVSSVTAADCGCNMQWPAQDLPQHPVLSSSLLAEVLSLKTVASRYEWKKAHMKFKLMQIGVKGIRNRDWLCRRCRQWRKPSASSCTCSTQFLSVYKRRGWLAHVASSMPILQKEGMPSSFTKYRCVSSLVDARCQRDDNLPKIGYCFWPSYRDPTTRTKQRGNLTFGPLDLWKSNRDLDVLS